MFNKKFIFLTLSTPVNRFAVQAQVFVTVTHNTTDDGFNP